MLDRIISSVSFTAVAIVAMAQAESSDSIKTWNLDEIVVEAQMQRTSPTSTTYIPTGKQKNSSQNAVDLLRQMAIPQIQINPVSEAVRNDAVSTDTMTFPEIFLLMQFSSSFLFLSCVTS